MSVVMQARPAQNHNDEASSNGPPENGIIDEPLGTTPLVGTPLASPSIVREPETDSPRQARAASGGPWLLERPREGKPVLLSLLASIDR